MARMMAVLLGVASSIAMASQAAAQGAPSREFGVDLSISSTGYDDAPDGVDRILRVGAPVDVRIGFLMGRASFEPRFGLSYQQQGDNSLMQFTPSLNVLFGLSGSRPHLGTYITAGVLMDVQSYDIDTGFGDSDSETETQLGVNIGIGHKFEWGDKAAFRPEFFVTKRLEKGDLLTDMDAVPGTTTFGIRIGMSFFH